MAKLNIGMSFSGGGYRAVTFHLGTLSFLNTIHIDDGKSLLDCVSVMPTCFMAYMCVHLLTRLYLAF